MALDVLIGGTNLNAAGQVKIAPEPDASANPGNVGAVKVFGENDPGAITGTVYLKSGEISDDFRARMGLDTLLLQDNCNALTQNTNKWAYNNNTLSITSPGAGFTQFGTVQGTSGSNGAFIRSFQYFPKLGTAPLWHETHWGMFTAALVANEVWSCGFGFPVSVTALPADGVWFQLTTAGLIGRLCYNGAFTNSGVLVPFASFTVGYTYKFSILVGEAVIEWWMNDEYLGKTDIPPGNAQAWIAPTLPAFCMRHCTGVVANTCLIRVAETTITLADVASNRPWQHQMAIMGQSVFLGQDGHTQGKTQQWTNSTAPTAAAATNTAAIAGATTLGGLVAVNPTLAVNSDGNLFTYLNPVATVNIAGRNLIITGVKVQGAVSVVLTGGPVVYAYAVAFGHTAVSLATAETGSYGGVTTHHPRTAFLGMETYPVTAAVGTIGAGCTLELASPIVVRPGEYIALTARNLGVVTSAGAITVGCTFTGYWE